MTYNAASLSTSTLSGPSSYVNMLRKRDISTLLSINSQLCELTCAPRPSTSTDMLRNNIRTFHRRTIHYVHWQYFLDMAEPLHFSLSMQQAKASLQKALQKALQDDDDDEEDDDNHLVLPDAKKEFIIKEMKDTTSQALHYLTKLRWNATVEGLDNINQWHSEIANFLLSIFQQRCEETKAMATILRQAGAFADGVTNSGEMAPTTAGSNPG